MEPHAIQELPLANRTIVPWSPPANYETYRRVLVSPTINTPPAFKGYGGWNGWPEVIRLRNGDLYVTFCAGYDHASIRTPFDAHLDHVAEFKRTNNTMGAPMAAWTFDWDCPTGGQIMWMRSRDSGRTWIMPDPTHGFQFDPWSYYPSACVLDDGTIFVVGTHEGIAADMESEVGPNPFGPRTSVVSAMRFRIRTPAEGEGIELLPIGG